MLKYLQALRRPFREYALRKTILSLSSARLHTQNKGSETKTPDIAYPARPEDILVTTLSKVHDRKIMKQVGMVTAGHVGATHFIHDILTALRGLFGGESHSYSQLLNSTTEDVVRKLQTSAKKVGATAVVRTRFQTATTMNRFIVGLHVSVLGYGTAVVCRPLTEAEKKTADQAEIICDQLSKDEEIKPLK